MSAKATMAIGGAAVVVAVAGFFFLILRSFSNTLVNENAGIGSVGGVGVELALLLFLGGLVLLVIGLIKWSVDKRRVR